MSGAVKHDQGKPDLSLIPMIAAVRMAEAFGVGLRYGRYNYCKGMEASRVMGALMRHAMRWFDGEEFDPDGQHHLGSVLACAAMLLRMQELGTLIDNRYVPPKPAALPEPTTVFEVVAYTTLSKQRLTLAAYPTRAEAEGHLPRHKRDYPAGSFTVEIEEVICD